MKKLAVIVSGWHFPLHFYEKMAAQKVPEGWQVDLFCVSHRDPSYAWDDKKQEISALGDSYPEKLDRILYTKMATVDEIKALGWEYEVYPNTVGDFGNTNQWLETHDYREYDMLLISHDDNFLLNDRLFMDVLTDAGDWLIVTNSTGSALSWREFLKVKLLGRAMNVRGSFEFFKPKVFEMLGGKFDLSGVTLSREGEFMSPKSFKSINNWNMVTEPFRRFLDENKLARRIKPLSKTYRMSEYCIEGERGFVSSIQPADRPIVMRGLARIQKIYDRNSSLI